MFSDIALNNIKRIKSHPKLLFIYRDPTKRIFSEYRFHRYKTKRFQAEFKDYVGWNGEKFNGEYYERGKIVSHINKWIKQYGEERIIIIPFDGLTQHPRDIMVHLSDLLDINPEFYKEYSFDQKNETFGLRSRRIHNVALNIRRYFPNFLRNIIRSAYYSFNKTALPATTSEENYLLDKLRVAYENENYDSLLPAIKVEP